MLTPRGWPSWVDKEDGRIVVGGLMNAISRIDR